MVSNSGDGERIFHLSVVRAALDAAPEAAVADVPAANAVPAKRPAAKAPSGKRNEGGRTVEPATGLPEGFPVTPLGKLGDTYFYLDKDLQFMALRAKDHGRLAVLGLAGDRVNFFYAAFPRYDKEGNVAGVRPELVAETLMAECSRRGLWNPIERRRGPGAWVGPEGELVLHCGSGVWLGPCAGAGGDGKWCSPGEYGGFVYASEPSVPRPLAEPVPSGEDGPGATLLTILKCWNWRRGELDALLMLGWIGAAMIGGALHHRPALAVTGRSGSGKSTLIHAVLERLLDSGVISVSDATAAGLWQALEFASLPVILDEQEAEEDNRQNSRLAKLMRQAATGGVILRGGADHNSVRFTARSCFLFSMILIPPLQQQDLNRLSILELGPLAPGQEQPNLNDAALRTFGAALRRRLADGWAKLPRVLEVYRAALAAVGHTARGCDQLGTLLACADIILQDHEIDRDFAAALAEQLSPASVNDMGDAEIADETRCLDHLLTSVVDVFRGGSRRTVGTLIETAADRENIEAAADNNLLGTYGLKVLREPEGDCLAVANSHQGLAGLFDRTHWAGRSGASGVWVQSLRRLPGAQAGQRRFGGRKVRCTTIPLSTVLDSVEG